MNDLLIQIDEAELKELMKKRKDLIAIELLQARKILTTIAVQAEMQKKILEGMEAAGKEGNKIGFVQ